MFGWGKKAEPKPVVPEQDLIKQSVPFTKAPDYIHPPREKPLTKEQHLKFIHVLKHFEQEDLQIPVIEYPHADTESKPLTYDEKAWLTRECILRYLRATKWIVQDAIDRITGTVSWRREFGIDHQTDNSKNIVTPELVAPESETGKEVTLGFDNDNRPCCYLKPGRQNTKNSFRQVQHLVFFLERTIDMMPSGQDSLALLIDFKQHPEIAANVATSKIPPLSVGKQVLHILQTHYPERLGKALLTNTPFLARTFMRLIWPFIDPLTKEKIVMDAAFCDFIPPEQLDKDFEGGLVDFEYDHSAYFPAICKITMDKRIHYMQRFEKFGAVVGLSEIDLRGADDEIQVPVGTHPVPIVGEAVGVVLSRTPTTVTASARDVSSLDKVSTRVSTTEAGSIEPSQVDKAKASLDRVISRTEPVLVRD